MKILPKKHKEIFDNEYFKMQAAAEGRPAVETQLIEYSKIEPHQNFLDRKKGTSWDGWLDMIVQRICSFFARGHFSVKLPKELEEIENDIDMTGNSIKEFRDKEMFPNVVIDSVLWGFVDMPEVEARPQNKAQEKELGLRPYVRLINPIRIYNWTENEFGALQEVIIETDKTIEIEKKSYQIYQRYTPGLYEEFYFEKGNEAVFIPESEKVIGNNIMPIIRKSGRKSRIYPGYHKIYLAGVADKEFELYNTNSNLISLLKAIDFQFLAGPKLGAGKDIGTKSYFELGEDGIFPKYIAPDSTNFRVNFERIEYLIKHIFALVGFKNRASLSDGGKSGEAMRIEDRQGEDKTKLFADICESFEVAYLNKMCEFLGIKSDKVEVKYPESYDTKTLTEDLERLEKIALTKNREFWLSEFKDIIRKKVPNLELQKKIISDAENAPWLKLEGIRGLGADIDGAMNKGVLSVVDLAKWLKPELAELEDEKIEKIIESIREQNKEITNTLNLQPEVESELEKTNQSGAE